MDVLMNGIHGPMTRATSVEPRRMCYCTVFLKVSMIGPVVASRNALADGSRATRSKPAAANVGAIDKVLMRGPATWANWSSVMDHISLLKPQNCVAEARRSTLIGNSCQVVRSAVCQATREASSAARRSGMGNAK